MRYPERSQYKHARSQYQVRNWATGEAGLRRRGELTVWLSDAALKAWRAPATGSAGGRPIYSDLAIEAALTLRMVFRLSLRQTEEFLRSLVGCLGSGLPIPDHTTLSGRLQRLGNLRLTRCPADQQIEVQLACKILNAMAGLGMPESRNVA